MAGHGARLESPFCQSLSSEGKGQGVRAPGPESLLGFSTDREHGKHGGYCIGPPRRYQGPAPEKTSSFTDSTVLLTPPANGSCHFLPSLSQPNSLARTRHGAGEGWAQPRALCGHQEPPSDPAPQRCKEAGGFQSLPLSVVAGEGARGAVRGALARARDPGAGSTDAVCWGGWLGARDFPVVAPRRT